MPNLCQIGPILGINYFSPFIMQGIYWFHSAPNKVSQVRKLNLKQYASELPNDIQMHTGCAAFLVF